MSVSYMTPIGIPPEAVEANPGYKAMHIGPPLGISDQDCGTPEVLRGVTPEGYPVLADYWRPTEHQLALLNAGGFIELRQYANQMVMHSMSVYAEEKTP